MSIPLEVGDLTPAWLTGALRSQSPDVEVRAVEVLDAHSGTTGRVKLQVHYERGGEELPETVFCKIAPFDARQRAFLRQVGIGVMEARFYASIASTVPVRLPRPWYAAIDDEGGFVMALEDLDAAGCSYPRPSDPDVEERAASTVEELAALHAIHWEDERFATDLEWVPERAGFGVGGGKGPDAAAAAGRFITFALDQFADEMPPAFDALGRLYAERTADVLDLWDEGERTLIHGDPHSGNLFTDKGRTGFFDWAMISRSPGMRDVAYYCCNSLPREARRSIEGDLLQTYRSTLGKHGIGLDPPLAEQQYRLFAVFSWVSATSTAAVGDRWQPAGRAMGAMQRATSAIDDLDSLGLLKELLL